jgi:hypothetical protein
LKRVFEIDITLCPLCGGQLRVIGDITDPDLIRKILDHVNSRAPRACRLGGPTHTRPHPTCSPNAEKHPATGPPARPKLQLPETRYPASGNDLSVREPCARLFRERREQASRSRGTFSTPTRQGRGKGPLNYLSSASSTAEDLASAAKDLGVTEDEIAACQNPT